MREMKDSGVEGIDLVPENWDRVQLEHCAYIIRGGSPRPIEQYMSETDEGYSWIKIGDTEKGNKYITHIREKIISAGLSKTRYVKAGTLLLTNSMSFGEPYILKVNGCIHDGWLAFSNLKFVDKEFLYYFLVSPACRVQFEKSSDGGVVQNLNIDKVKHSIVYFPSVSEQQAIVAFLDSKCAEIDALSADIQSEIETLEAYKRSVITEVVTKGLDKTVPMKDSGIEWVGEIPATWDVHPVYAYFEERKNKNYALQEQNLLSLSYGKIIRKDIDTLGGLLPASFNTYNIVEAGDIIIRPTDLQNDKRSLRTGLVTEKGIITSAYIDLAPRGNINSEYFHYLLHSYDVQKVFYNMGNGVRQGLNYSEFSKLMVFTPSRDEQDTIVSYLNAKCAEIEAIINQKQEQLSILAEYKKSVIYEYVTGKKEVSSN